jgi:hypothetical protein
MIGCAAAAVVLAHAVCEITDRHLGGVRAPGERWGVGIVGIVGVRQRKAGRVGEVVVVEHDRTGGSGGQCGHTDQSHQECCQPASLHLVTSFVGPRW